MIAIGVSSCLLGQRVRYDGRDKFSSVVAHLESCFELKPFCPELAVGMGVPRPPIRLVENSGMIRAVEVENPTVDHTNSLSSLVVTFATTFSCLSGFVLTEKSPSCGVNSAKLYNPQGQITGYGSGLFAKGLAAAFPDMPLIEAARIEDPQNRKAFVLQCFEYFKRV